MPDHGRRVIPVHPNSMAARQWGRTHWVSGRNLYAEAAEARRAGDSARADALTRAAARATSPKLLNC